MIDINLRELDRLERYFLEFPEIADQAARLTVNYAIRRAATNGKREIRSQVNLSAAYIGNPRNKDAPLHFAKLATRGSNSAILVAKARPTSLARFAVGAPVFGRQKSKVRVRVKPGSSRLLSRAFFVRLRRGKTLTQDNYNVGIAVRLKAGERLENKYDKAQQGPGIAILYAPSVEQVFSTVALDIQRDIELDMEREFLRQFTRLNK